MKIELSFRDILMAVIMAIGAILILIQRDETGYALVWDFHGLMAAACILLAIPCYYVALIIHGLCQMAQDYLD